MKFGTICLISALLAAAITPSSARRDHSVDAKYSGTYKGVSLRPRYAIPVPKEGLPEIAPASSGMGCDDPVLDGQSLSISCANEDFLVWIECDNGNRYTTTKVYKTVKVTITCPDTSKATAGGASGFSESSWWPFGEDQEL